MIGVKGQALFKFKITDRFDFLLSNELSEFSLIEEVGNVLPSYKFVFTIRDDNLLRYFNEGNVIEVAFGADELSLFNVKLAILHSIVSREGKSSFLVCLTGLYSALPYLSQDKVFITDSLSGVEVIKQIVKSYFEPDFNISLSQDKQRWIQYGISDRMFVNKIWMHSFVENSFIAIGISSDGRFILRDMRKLVSEDPKWKFISHTPKAKDEIYYEGDTLLDTESGFINQCFGYDRYKDIFDLDSGNHIESFSSVKPMVAMTRMINKSKEISSRNSGFGVINDNVHNNYWNAYIRNLSNLAVFNSSAYIISYPDLYKPMRVLDIVSLKEIGISGKESSEAYSGIYVISKIKRTMMSNAFSTTVKLSREAVNMQVIR